MNNSYKEIFRLNIIQQPNTQIFYLNNIPPLALDLHPSEILHFEYYSEQGHANRVLEKIVFLYVLYVYIRALDLPYKEIFEI